MLALFCMSRDSKRMNPQRSDIVKRVAERFLAVFDDELTQHGCERDERFQGTAHEVAVRAVSLVLNQNLDPEDKKDALVIRDARRTELRLEGRSALQIGNNFEKRSMLSDERLKKSVEDTAVRAARQYIEQSVSLDPTAEAMSELEQVSLHDSIYSLYESGKITDNHTKGLLVLLDEVVPENAPASLVERVKDEARRALEMKISRARHDAFPVLTKIAGSRRNGLAPLALKEIIAAHAALTAQESELPAQSVWRSVAHELIALYDPQPRYMPEQPW